MTPPSAQESVNALRLNCHGTEERDVIGFSRGTAFGRHHAVSVIGGNSQLDPFGEPMDIDMEWQTGEVRMPRRFLPPLHGGDDGWFEFKI
ncbi:hypothetical protein [Sphingomonas oryzagri]|uniref:Uncharacterized protein n=1 Tax=Sphingomonas oryzagri TaxID=3042314 RepID=A0ABT6N2C1_9SPHN|nr:hypothetical protein [Sphingomonas oryzagri]MDH7639223.1 hypothetical protein [Sphingomonas oryzagri]